MAEQQNPNNPNSPDYNPFSINTTLQGLSVNNPLSQIGQASSYSDALNSLNGFFNIPQIQAPTQDQYDRYFNNLASQQFKTTPTVQASGHFNQQAADTVNQQIAQGNATGAKQLADQLEQSSQSQIDALNQGVARTNQLSQSVGTQNLNDIYSRVLQTQGDDLSSQAGQSDFQRRFNIQASRGSAFNDQLISQIPQTTQGSIGASVTPIQSTSYSDYNPYSNGGGR